MNEIDIDDIGAFVKGHIEQFHKDRLGALEKTNLSELLGKKNPYLFKAKNIITAQGLVASLLDAKLSASEETIFGGFLEDLAIYVAEKTLNAQKSSTTGIDLQYEIEGDYYLMTIKSGLNWGNNDQWVKLKSNFETASKVLRQTKRTKSVSCILGACYGKRKRTTLRGIIDQVCGQQFWHMISGQKDFYKEIVEPLGYQASKHNAAFEKSKASLIEKFVREFTTDYCGENGNILWDRILAFNSGNLEEGGESKRMPTSLSQPTLVPKKAA